MSKKHRQQSEPAELIVDRAVDRFESGSVNGHGVPIKLLKLLEEYQRKAAAVQTVINLLTADAHASSAKRLQTTLRTAAITEQLRKQTQHAAKPRKIAAPGHGKIHAQRKRSAAFLQTFSITEPRLPKMKRAENLLGPLVRRGYLVKTADGYVRTNKVYEV